MASEGNKWREGLVSIVTPVYNGEAHLAGMLSSVLAQTYPHIEMILADDGSGDATLQVAEGYRKGSPPRATPTASYRHPTRTPRAPSTRGCPM